MFEDINTLKSVTISSSRPRQTNKDRQRELQQFNISPAAAVSGPVIKQPWLTFVKSIWKWYLISFVSCLPPTALHTSDQAAVAELSWGGDLWKLHKINKPTVNCGLRPGRVRIHFIGCGRKGRGRGLWVVGWQDPSLRRGCNDFVATV